LLLALTPGGGSKLIRRLGNHTKVHQGSSSLNHSVEGSHRRRKMNRLSRQ
jgi:hypothetical protein